MTEPTDAEIIALCGSREFSTIGVVREALRRWGTPPAVATPQADSVTKAGALILAELERIDRAARKQVGANG